MLESNTHNRNYDRVSKAIQYLVEQHKHQPTLSELADVVGLSKYHLQRLFSDWAGVTPKQFLQYLTKEHAKQKLRTSTVFDSALSSGLSGGGRLHDLMVTCESVTPGEYRSQGLGLQIMYGVHPSRFGDCLVAITGRGVCKLSFIDSPHARQAEIDNLNAEWRNAEIIHDQRATESVIEKIFSRHPSSPQTLNVLLKGSPFQIKVWEALLKIPESSLTTYQGVADKINRRSAVRAVATAIGQNQVGYLVPCHRVIRSTGALGKYRWGEIRKNAILGWEAASCEQ